MASGNGEQSYDVRLNAETVASVPMSALSQEQIKQTFGQIDRLVPATAPMPGHTRDGYDGYEHYSESHRRHDASV